VVLSVVINIINGLRKKFVNSSLAYKTCPICKKEYPRDENYFYRNKHPSKIGAFKYSNYCITCENKRTKKWKANNKTKKQLSDLAYQMGEKGYFNQLWQGVATSRHGNNFKNEEEFVNCWKEQKKIFGIKCPILGIEMTMTKGKGKPTDTNISKDRILSSRSYSKQNLIFVCWRVNNMKRDITPQVAKRYLEIVKERYGTDDPK
jgi:hypothetical protein